MSATIQTAANNSSSVLLLPSISECTREKSHTCANVAASPSATLALWRGIVGFTRVRDRTSVRTLIVRRPSRDARHLLATKTTTLAQSRMLPAPLRRPWPETAWLAQAPRVLPGQTLTRLATTDRPSLLLPLHKGLCPCHQVLRWSVPTECNTVTWEIPPCPPTCATTCTLAAPHLRHQQVSPTTSGRHRTPRLMEQRLQRHWSRASRTDRDLAALLGAPT